MKVNTKIMHIVAVTFATLQLSAQDFNHRSAGNLENQDSIRQLWELQRLEIAKQMEQADIMTMVTKNEDGSFGYFVFIDGHLLLDQKTIPAVIGNAGFINPEEAEKTAKLAIEKIKEGYVPPTISIEELEVLQITMSKKP